MAAPAGPMLGPPLAGPLAGPLRVGVLWQCTTGRCDAAQPEVCQLAVTLCLMSSKVMFPWGEGNGWTPQWVTCWGGVRLSPSFSWALRCVSSDTWQPKGNQGYFPSFPKHGWVQLVNSVEALCETVTKHTRELLTWQQEIYLFIPLSVVSGQVGVSLCFWCDIDTTTPILKGLKEEIQPRPSSKFETLHKTESCQSLQGQADFFFFFLSFFNHNNFLNHLFMFWKFLNTQFHFRVGALTVADQILVQEWC